MRSWWVLNTVSILVGVGCTKGSPTFGVLNQDAIPRITFDGQTERTLGVIGLQDSTPIKGECDPRVAAIRVSVINTSINGKLDAISTSPPVVKCTEGGTFAFTLRALSDLFANAAANQTYRIEFRAETPGGLSNPSVLSVSYVREPAEKVRITSGGTESPGAPGARLAASATFRADVRVSHFVAPAAPGAPESTRATSPRFQLSRGRAGQTTP